MSTNDMEKKNYGKQFFSGVAILAISTFLVKIIGLIYKIPMMKYLTSEGMGYFNTAYDIYSLLFVISTTGIPVAISILVSENKVTDRTDNIKRIYKVSLVVLGSLGLIGTSILAISPTLLLICISSAIRGYFQGHQIMLPTAVSQVIEALGKLLLGLGFAVLAFNKGYSVHIVAAYAALGLTVGEGFSLLYLILHKWFYSSKHNSLSINYEVESSTIILKKLVKIAIPITISATILSLTKIIDMTMILGRLNDIGYTQAQGNAVYGAYSTMAVSIYNLPSTLISAISLPLVPMLASAIEKRDTVKEKSVMASSLKLTALIGFPTGLGISVFSKQILTLLFADQSNEIEYVAPLLSILGISVFLTSMITITNAILQAYHLVNKPIISMIVGTLVKLVLSYILIGNEATNIYGAPISTFFSVVVIVSINLYYIIKRCGKLSSIYSLFVKPFISSAIAVVLGIGIYFILISKLSLSVSILLTIAFVVLIYFIVVLKIKAIDKEEIAMLPKGETIVSLLSKIKLI